VKHAIWSNHRTWKAAGWELIGENKGGGQGEAYTTSRDGEVGFLKILKSQKDIERRRRLYREATALLTYEHSGIPKLIESNASHFDDLGTKLYLVTELVTGSTLRESIEKNGIMSLQHAITLVKRLLEIVEYYQARDGIHRDIKPDNILLRNGEPGTPVLVDFGLAWQPDDQDAHATEVQQELGNRFLRLNELAPGSPQKRDPRSDITFVVGIFFYVLTGHHPNILEEPETGRRPHQRLGMPELIRQIAGERSILIMGLFDRGFSPMLNSRFQSANEFIEELERIMETKSEVPDAQILEHIKKRLEAQGAERNRAYTAKIHEAVNVIRSVRNEIGVQIGNHLIGIETGFYKSDPTHHWLNIGFDTPGTSYPRFRPKFDFTIIGDELVVSLFSEDRQGTAQTLWRTQIAKSDLGPLFREKVQGAFVAGLGSAFGR